MGAAVIILLAVGFLIIFQPGKKRSNPTTQMYKVTTNQTGTTSGCPTTKRRTWT